jgi:hypothetical protein
MSEVDDILAELDEEGSVEDRHAGDIDAAEEKYEGGDKIDHKLQKKLESLEHKFETNALRTAVESYEAKADDIEKALFEDVKADLKSYDDFERVQKFITDRATKLREREAQLAADAEKRAEENAARAWGTGPIGRTPPPATDEEKELMERVRAGDTDAAFKAIVGNSFGAR